MTGDYGHSFAGELLGTFMLVFFGCSTVAVTVLFSAYTGLFQVAVVWGISVTLAIYATRHLSCAHLNPAVSLAMVIAGRMDVRKLPVYWVAQLTGGFLAGAAVYAIFSPSMAVVEAARHIVRGAPESVLTAMLFGEYYPNPSSPVLCSVSPAGAFAVEALGTFWLVLIIFALTEGCNVGRPSSDVAPILIGLTITVLISIFAPLTMAGFNPARDFGPRLFAFLAGWGKVAIPGPRGGFFTIYILAPLVGGSLASLLFHKLLEPLMRGKHGACSCKDHFSL
ncbi:MIP/aquaporin family protein [Desulfofundulus thermosubterraneus]|uniref:Glycerol uptake facilitator protein n=1 Tax=Desulfofundulus thermosubterraneus DSM 16057 TaxID=1121432 RepID=A0A1M6HVU8_9FIRM|nr:MIP/aquaporin family protein [Desulfofundulus thermosubterraneus]SHJ26319.1 glycerol uptake facilitator protein [Desulfofundulus thermosubterraneus DSM 16057]